MTKKGLKTTPLIILVFTVIAVSAIIIALITSLNNQSTPSSSQSSNIGTSSVIDSNTSDVGKYKVLSMSEADIHKGELVLVNADHPYEFDEDLDLVSLMSLKSDSYYIKDSSVLLRESIIPSLNDMLDDFYQNTGLKTVNVISGHRTYDYQENLLSERINRDGEEEALKYVAKPGSSEHHLGLAFDFGLYLGENSYKDYDGTGEYEYINQNCYKYGFIVRYTDAKKELTGIYYEPWHFRYVGVPHSYLIVNNDFCYEEYIDFLKQYPFDGEHLIFDVDGTEYEIYYEDSLEVYVPTDKEYTVSGNNVDGFIVTIKS